MNTGTKTLGELEMEESDKRIRDNIVVKIINYAIQRGYDFDGFLNEDYPYFRLATKNEVRLTNGLKDKGSFKLFEIIFNHEFAKAFWGERQNERIENGRFYMPQLGWKHHLMMMVVDENPIDYMARYLPKDYETN